MISLRIRQETWPLLKSFNISRSSITESLVLVVEIQDGAYVGRGECEPHENDQSKMGVVAAIIEGIRPQIEQGVGREDLQNLLPSGPARNAVDCALWDLEAKKSGKRAWHIAGVDLPGPLVTAYTISINSPEEMAAEAKGHSHRSLLKVKLGKDGSLARIKAVRHVAPNATIIVDANEAWDFEKLTALAPTFAGLGVAMIEQPLPAGSDQQLDHYTGPIPLCADESCMDRGSLEEVDGRYEFINIKLDKTGGLTEALLLAEEASSRGLKIMVGCMTGTSLAMAPAMVIGAGAMFCDLDGPLLLAKDRIAGLVYDENSVQVPNADVWG